MTPHPDQITTLERLLAEATELPWSRFDDHDVYGREYANRIWGPDGPGHGLTAEGRGNKGASAKSNAALIVAAVNALPSLLAAVRENERLREALKPFCPVLSDEWGGESILSMGDYQHLKVKHFRAARSALNQPLEGGSSAQDRHPGSGDLTSPHKENEQ